MTMMDPSRPSSTPCFPPPPTTISGPEKRNFKQHKKHPEPSINPPPHSLHRSRKFLLPTLLLLTFTTTILATIYTYCILFPHTRLTQANPDATLNDSIFQRRATTTSTSPDTSNTSIPSSQPPEPLFPLIAYTILTPVLTLLFLLLELTLHILRPTLTSRPSTHYLLILTTTLLLCGWTATTSLTIHCELPHPSSLTTTNMSICPAAVRGHFMFGIHELSIARVVIGWVVVGGLVVHLWCLGRAVRWVRVYGGSGMGGGGGGRKGLGLRHGDVGLVRDLEDGERVQRELRRGWKGKGGRFEKL